MDSARQGAMVQVTPGGKLARVISVDGRALLIDLEGRLKWIPARDAVVVAAAIAGTADQSHDAGPNYLDYPSYPGQDGAEIAVGDWITGSEALASLGASGVGVVAGFATEAGSLRIRVEGADGDVELVPLALVTRVLRGGCLNVVPESLAWLPYRCHVCGNPDAVVEQATGISGVHGGPRASPCSMSGRRLIDVPGAPAPIEEGLD